MKSKRDPERIVDFLDRLEMIWMRHPDINFGQLIADGTNAISASGRNTYYLEDNELIKYLELYYREGC